MSKLKTSLVALAITALPATYQVALADSTKAHCDFYSHGDKKCRQIRALYFFPAPGLCRYHPR